jgi:hypothetical protein
VSFIRITHPPGFDRRPFLEAFYHHGELEGCEWREVAPIPGGPRQLHVLGDKHDGLRITGLIRGDGAAELRRWEAAKERWALRGRV